MRSIARLTALFTASLCLGATGDLPQIPQSVLTLHINFSRLVKPVDRGTCRHAFESAISRWEELVPGQARFKVLDDSVKIGTADFEVVFSPEKLKDDEGCLGCFDGTYTKGRGRLHGVIYVITERGHWESPRQEIPMSYLDLKWVIMHELGHGLGLGHHCDPHGIMNYFDHDLIPRRFLTCPSADEIEDVREGRITLVSETDKICARP